MKKTFIALTAGIMGLASPAFAQTAMEQAIAQKVCGDATPSSATFIDNGANIQVACPPATAPAAGTAAIPTVLTGTAAGSGGAAGALLGLVVIAAAIGGGSSGTTSTTTTTGTGGS